MNWAQTFQALVAAKVVAISGPTFSIYGEGVSQPASHNITMLTRHHRYCAEAAASGLTVIPNLYWRNRADRVTWSRWLDDNPTVTWVARDFSRTKQWACFEPEFDGLLDILDGQTRILNVLITGVGEKKLPSVQCQICEHGGRCSFVTSRPIVAPPNENCEDRAAGVRMAIAHFREVAGGSMAA